MKKKEILIIGSGFSALSCYSALENKFNVSLIDLPNNNLKEKYTFERLFKPLLRVDGSIVVKHKNRPVSKHPQYNTQSQ